MKLHTHQQKAYKALKKKLKKHHLALFIGETRSGKTRPLLELCKGYENPLVVTKKNAMGGIHSEALEMGGINNLTVINYHSVGKVDPKRYDLVIYDECGYYIGSFPKRSLIWNTCKMVTQDADVVFASATPTSEGYAKLFNMFALSKYSIWSKYGRFTTWHKDYGLPYQMRLNGYNVTKYERTKIDLIKKDMKHLIVTMTRKDAGHQHEAVDKLIDIDQSKKQKKMYKALRTDLIIEKEEILADTPVKLMMKLHQISGGFVKREDNSVYSLKKNPKLEWLKKNVDPNITYILAQYQAEQEMLAEHFPHTGSVTKMAAGVDLSMYENLIIYSMNFSAQNYEQVRSRQMNIKRDSSITIKYLISGIDSLVYKAVKMKKNFTSSWFTKHAE